MEYLSDVFVLGTAFKAFVKVMDIVAITAQIAGVVVPIFVHKMKYGEYRWLVSGKTEVSNIPRTDVRIFIYF